MWFGTSRLRGGYLVSDNLLLYGSGGLASGTTEVTVSNNAAGLPCSFAGACPFGSDSKTRYGWALGLGAEYAYGPWSITLDYIWSARCRRLGAFIGARRCFGISRSR
jgi:outer membrane immunogenic protein